MQSHFCIPAPKTLTITARHPLDQMAEALSPVFRGQADRRGKRWMRTKGKSYAKLFKAHDDVQQSWELPAPTGECMLPQAHKMPIEDQQRLSIMSKNRPRSQSSPLVLFLLQPDINTHPSTVTETWTMNKVYCRQARIPALGRQRYRERKVQDHRRVFLTPTLAE